MGVFSLSLVDLRWFYQGSSGVLLGSFVFFRLNTYVLRMILVSFGGSSIVVIPKNNSALNRYFLCLILFSAGAPFK